MPAWTTRRRARAIFSWEFLSIEKWGDVGKSKCDQHQRGDDPKEGLVSGVDLRRRTDFPWFAGRGRAEEAPVREKQGDQCHADEDRAIRFEHGQVADPGAAETECNQYQRTEAAGRGQDRGEAAREQRPAPVLLLQHAFLLPNIQRTM